MVTENLKHLIATVLESSSTAFGSIRLMPVTGQGIVYANGLFTFPASRTEAFTASATAAGISFGRGTTPATELDTNLESTITSGINVSLTSRTPGTDDNGNPVVRYSFTVTNTSSTNVITIGEVGYKQTLRAASRPKGTSNSEYVCLLDRTVFDEPISIAPEDAVVITYTLRTIVEPIKQKFGVDLVSFTSGTDAQIAALLDAAQAGAIDLQADAGWRIGDMRPIYMSAWTGENNVAHAAQWVNIVISSFDEYMNCGNVIQFDFMDCPTGNQRMNPTNTTTGGYGSSVMKTTTLPAMVEALPAWMQSRLKTFDVLTRADGSSSSVISVPNNKLALRSNTEIFGTTTYGQEGVQVELYKNATYRIKPSGLNGSSVGWWERSPYTGTNFANVSNGGGATNTNASYAYGVAPFGCI